MEIIKKIAWNLLGTKIYIKLKHWWNLGYWPTIDNPTTYNEKTHHRKVNSRDKTIVKCADKYEVREYVKERLSKKYLVGLIDVKNKIDKADICGYPKSFVLKPNNRSGGVRIIKNKNLINRTDIKYLNKLVSKKYGYRKGEWWYSEIKPRIVVEKLVESEDGGLPDGYKVYCFNSGKKTKQIIRLIRDRDTDKKDAFFDEKWKRLNIKYNENKKIRGEVEKPKNLPEIKKVAKKLSEGFSHVRVDLLQGVHNLYFCEMTFADASGFVRFEPELWDKRFGELWNM
ncbi:ATP-grasp fold amidoligase family protein [Salinibacter ruber]|uniref:ATP-grasp fold amidoligase family protein n=1 Tax=Salinibacter ruber TaxID=146919 RepID=UPI002167277B|nr:ATP-grasp fold amidoligase family protein [Salinibacter ruber]MCS4150731.1 hypothetical protein [Salinibacter ruber]